MNILSTIFVGKEKAWVSAVGTFLTALVIQKTTGDAIDPTVVNNFIATTSELVNAALASGVMGFMTWVTGNSGFVKAETVPAVEPTVPPID